MKQFVLTALFLFVVFINPVHAQQKSFIASATDLDIDVYEVEYDVATITLSGPNGFFKKIQIDASDTKIDFDKLGALADGRYKYEIQYANNGGVEFVTDRKTGRDGAVRNLGQIEVVTGYFNVKDDEFVITTEENELIPPSSNLNQN
ncbi:hypothetical protein [Shewanella waksmanii]|uniref:hypothetical protein n=1 Tax=Shewanella waksmanii TaxID=213783 RepID=UPI003736B1A0